MDADRWQRLSPLLDALFDLDHAQRAQRLGELHQQDSELAAELATLIALEESRGDFLAEPLVPPPAGKRAGSEVGPYRLERMLGEGGMGQVWLAARADGLYQRRVALKLLRPGLADANLRLRFSRERQILARLAHPHIARLLDAGISADGLPYLALEYVEGEPITDYCRQQHVALATRLHMFGQICDAVSHAHANLIVHRDLKPSNILVTPAGDVRLLDFGIAKLLDSDAPVVEQTRTGVRAFTLHYAAPEQIRGEPVTTMTDVYSLGVVLYELLTDTKPYRLKRHTDAEWEEAILARDPLRPSQAVMRRGDDDSRGAELAGDGVRPDSHALRRHARQLAGDLDNIVLKTLSKRPEQRYPSVEALALDLQRYEAGRPVQARPQSWAYRTRKYMRRHRWALASGALVTAVLTLALAIVAWQARQAVAEAGRAQAMQDFMVGLFENAGAAPDGSPLDLRGLLDAAVQRGDRELARQPRARAELLGVIARLRSGLGDYEQAAQLLDRQAAILAVTGGIPASLRLESLGQRGEALRRTGDARGCIALMQPALAQARREQAQRPVPSAEFYAQLGRCRAANDELQGARLLFERALALRRSVPGAEVAVIESRLDLAGLQARTGDPAAAIAQYEAARTQLRLDAGDRHPLLATIGRNLATLQTAQPVVAERELRGALAIALDSSGAQHPATHALRSDLAALLASEGRYAGAREQLRLRHAGLVARLGPLHAQVGDSHAALARLAVELDDRADALRHARAALAIARRQDDPLQVAERQVGLAQVLDASGRPAQAWPLLLDARSLRVANLGSGHGSVGDSERLLGEVGERLARDDARAHLVLAVQLTRAGHGSSALPSRAAELALARHDALQGDPSALPPLDALARAGGDDAAWHALRWQARTAAAQARCRGDDGGHREAARRTLDGLLAELRRALPDGGTPLREAEAARAACGPSRAGQAGQRPPRQGPARQGPTRLG